MSSSEIKNKLLQEKGKEEKKAEALKWFKFGFQHGKECYKNSISICNGHIHAILSEDNWDDIIEKVFEHTWVDK